MTKKTTCPTLRRKLNPDPATDVVIGDNLSKFLAAVPSDDYVLVFHGTGKSGSIEARPRKKTKQVLTR